MKSQLKIIFIGIVLSTMMSSCLIGHINASNKTSESFTVENNAIPSDFGSDPNTVLLVMRAGMKNYDRFLEKAVAEYHGKFEYTMQARMSQKKYEDVKIYRYYFDYEPGTKKSARNQDGTTYDYSMKQFYVFDRLEEKKYSCGKEFSKFALAMRSYFKNLEEKRVSYK